MKYTLLFYLAVFIFTACQQPTDYTHEMRSWNFVGYDTIERTDTIELLTDRTRRSNNFNGYFDAGDKYKKLYYRDSLIADNIDLLTKEKKEINNQLYHLE